MVNKISLVNVSSIFLMHVTVNSFPFWHFQFFTKWQSDGWVSEELTAKGLTVLYWLQPFICPASCPNLCAILTGEPCIYHTGWFLEPESALRITPVLRRTHFLDSKLENTASRTFGPLGLSTDDLHRQLLLSIKLIPSILLTSKDLSLCSKSYWNGLTAQKNKSISF